MSDAEAYLPKPPGALRQWLAVHPRFIDGVIVTCYLLGGIPLALFEVVTVVLAFTAVDSTAPQNGTAVAEIVAAIILTTLRLATGLVALSYRRRAPVIGLIAVTLTLLGESSPLAAANLVALWFLLYAVPVYRDVRSGWISYGVVLALRTFASYFDPLVSAAQGRPVVSSNSLGGVVLDAILLLVVLLIGINLGNRRRYLAAIIDRAHQLARERDQLAQLAVAEERSRIAREIHDIVAHSVSVMIALSEGAARAAQTAPEAAENAMRRSAETGRTALAEMRRLLGALQADNAAELAPQPSVSDIPELVRGFEAAGLKVSFSEINVTVSDRMQELAMYRVVQEGLTNVLRYAGKGASAEVMLAGSVKGTNVSVRDHGRVPGTAGPATGVGSGRGLAGLAERVRVFGGSIESGPVVPGPGWELRAYLPNGPQAVRSREEGS